MNNGEKGLDVMPMPSQLPPPPPGGPPKPMIVTGNDCSNCGATLEECDSHIRARYRGCCDVCYTLDTHRLVVPAQGYIERLVALEATLVTMNERLIREMAAGALFRHNVMVEISGYRHQVTSLQERVDLLEHQMAVLLSEDDDDEDDPEPYDELGLPR
jgi:hypothetical protein